MMLERKKKEAMRKKKILGKDTWALRILIDLRIYTTGLKYIYVFLSRPLTLSYVCLDIYRICSANSLKHDV